MMPTQKEMNSKIAKLVAETSFWNSEVFCRYFADDFTMDIPSAPVGMPNHYSTWEAERCFEWLNRSVRKWHSKIIEFYPTPDPDQFWVHGSQGGEVFWGEHDGSLETDFFMRIEFKHGKVSYINWRFHSHAWLLAAGKRYHGHVMHLPKNEDGSVDDYNKGFLIDPNDPDIQAYINAPVFGSIPKGQDKEGLDISKEAIYKRRQINIYQFASGIDRDKYRSLESLNEDYKKFAYFVGDPYPVEGGLDDTDNDKVLFAWNKVCSPWMYRDPRSKFYPTDDPNVIFVEMNAHGPGCWRANGVKVGHYHQDYLVRLILDDLGRLVRFEEIANPVNGLNSTASEIDNFPYYH
jgi:hypothetical protein